MQPSPDQLLTLHPVFCRKDLAEVLRKRNGKASPNTINAHLVRWMKQGRVVQVKKGVYVHSAGAGRSDKFALASRLAPDALLSHHTALELNGVAQSAFNRVTFVTLSCVKPIRFEECQYEPIRPRPSLCLEKYQTRRNEPWWMCSTGQN